MPYSAGFYAQDGVTGRIGAVLDAISAAAACPYDSADVAVAYATALGVRLLGQRLAGTVWEVAIKRFLISIDYGITEPGALTELAAVPNSQVRVPNGLGVLKGPGLWPPGSTFHTKAYMFHVNGTPAPLGVAIGSANITVSALATGAEAVAAHTWNGTLSPAELGLLNDARPLLEWFEDAWKAADPLADVLPAYQSMFKASRRPQATREDRAPAAQAFIAHPATVEVAGPLAAQLISAQALWVKADTLYHNRGDDKPGNQLDIPRGTRVFFGFPAAKVPKNRVLGYVEIQVPGFAAVRRSVRFADNAMDKVNLPIPESDGPATYDNAYLIFDRAGIGPSGLKQFRLTVADLAALSDMKKASRNTVDLYMTSGRPYGLLF
jgi:hypothetical protein